MTHDTRQTSPPPVPTNGNGKKVGFGEALRFFTPSVVVLGGCLSFAFTIFSLRSSVEQISGSLQELRAGRYELAKAFQADSERGLEREIRLGIAEKRLDACCPYARGK